MTPDREQEIRAREQAATPGPWQSDGAEIYGTLGGVLMIDLWVGETLDIENQQRSNADAAFMADARSAVPELLAEVDRLRARVAELEGEAYGDAAVRLVDPVSQIRHLHACVAAQRSRADVLDRLCGKYQERAELLEGSPWERAVAGLNALVDAGVAFHVEPDGHISAPFSDEHIEWDLKAKRWVLTHDDEDEDVPPAPVPSAEDEARAAVDRSVKAQFPAIAAFLAEDPHDSPLHHSYAVGRDLPEGGTQ